MVDRQLKYIQARLSLLRLIHDFSIPVGSRLPPEREMIHHLRCGVVTMRHALADLESSGIIEKRHGSGTYLRQDISAETFTHHLLCLDISRDEALPGPGMNHLRHFLASRGIGLTSLTVPDFGLSVIKAAKNCLGIIVTGWVNDEILQKLQSLKLPIVVKGSANYTLPIPNVTVDLRLTAKRLTDIMVANGRRTIALFRGEDGYVPADHMEQGYRHAMGHAGLAPLVLKVRDRFDYARAIADFMPQHPALDGILLEHSTFIDFSSWAWETGYTGHPAIGFLSRESDHRLYRQLPNFLWVTFEDMTIKAASMLLDNIIEGTPMVSLKLPPIIPMVDTDSNTFIS